MISVPAYHIAPEQSVICGPLPTEARNTNPMHEQLIRAMPKAKLHVHLEGCIQPETLFELAIHHDRLHQLPAADIEGLRRWFRFRDFPHFVEIYMAIQSL